MELETRRLVLRPWEEGDAAELYELARNPNVGLVAGWLPHTSVQESLQTIRNVLCGPEAYAICFKESRRPIGAIELLLRGHTVLTEREDEAELGYWLGQPYWGRGIVPEATQELLRRAFQDLGMRAVWCAYYDGNTKSSRVQEKTGFTYHHTVPDMDVPLLEEKRVCHVTHMSRADWEALQGGAQ